MAGTSSFTEGSSVFGGQANLLEAINNIFTIYKPDVIAVHTTCLSETTLPSTFDLVCTRAAFASICSGCSDAATTLMALNEMCGLRLKKAQLMKLGATLGADVPFFVFGNSAFATGTGN